MPRRTLAQWLEYIERQHPSAIAMGLDRVRRVLDAMDEHFSGPVITVGGTNGKGSVCAMLDAILRAAGYRVGMYTSPHLLAYNERVALDGEPASDDLLVEGFEAVERARGDTPLTYFEFGTLAAWHVFARTSPDVLVLEVGLGGRLDAVNVFEPDCAVVTRVALDHMDYLGPDRESIGAEKAGIFRTGKPAICADPDPPRSLIAHAEAIGADLRLLGRDFGWRGDRTQWRYVGKAGDRPGLAPPALRGAYQFVNASAALAALEALRDRLPVSAQAVRNGLAVAKLPGRFQVLPGRPTIVLDVAHNPDAAAALASNVEDMGFYRETFGVIGMLRDKDIDGVCKALKGRVSVWFAADLDGPRAATAAELAEAIRRTVPGPTFSRLPRHARRSLRRVGKPVKMIEFSCLVPSLPWPMSWPWFDKRVDQRRARIGR